MYFAGFFFKTRGSSGERKGGSGTLVGSPGEGGWGLREKRSYRETEKVGRNAGKERGRKL